MADEDAFDFSAVEEIPPEEGAEAPAEGAAEGAPVERVLAEGEGKYDHYEKVALPQYTLHWVRPLILGYRYNYDYRSVELADDVKPSFQCFINVSMILES